MVIPDHSHYKGMNDRFALASPAVAYDYGQRLDFTVNNCGNRPIHAELYALWWATTRGYKVVRMPRFDFFRIRATGTVAPGDAMTLPGCDIVEMYKFPVPKGYEQPVRDQRRRAFREGTGWAALRRPAVQLAQHQAQQLQATEQQLQVAQQQAQELRDRAQDM